MPVTQVARVKTLRHEAEGVLSVELWPADGAAFEPFSAGSHIDLHLPGGLVRSYSLMNCSSERNRYVIGVLNDRNSRGGSRWLHEQLKVAGSLSISAPRNNFALDESASHSVLVAGGIGITPLYSMCLRLLALGKSVELIYCARSRAEAALLDALANTGVAVTYHFDDERGGAPDLTVLLADRDAQSHFYCCGPAPMLAAFEQAAEVLGYGQVHIERFAAIALPEAEPQAEGQGYDVVLERSGQTVQVAAGQSVLDALLDAGMDVEYSCCEGICGACETRVLEGQIEHRDSVLSKTQRESNTLMMVCVSRSCGGRLVLDL